MNPTPTGKIRFTTHVGAEVIISQLSLYARLKLQEVAQQRFPFPDPKQFERMLPDVQQFGTSEAAVVKGHETPEYQAAYKEAKAKQDNCLHDLILDVCIDCEEKAAWLAVYREELTAMRGYVDDLPDDDWLATFKCFLTSIEDIRLIFDGICQALPLSQEEIVDAYKFFRFSIQRADLPRAIAKQGAPGSTGQVRRAVQPLDLRASGGAAARANTGRDPDGAAGTELVQPAPADEGGSGGGDADREPVQRDTAVG